MGWVGVSQTWDLIWMGAKSVRWGRGLGMTPWFNMSPGLSVICWFEWDGMGGYPKPVFYVVQFKQKGVKRMQSVPRPLFKQYGVEKGEAAWQREQERRKSKGN
jgi:hypothetical protein